jgi:hypothetical protein
MSGPFSYQLDKFKKKARPYIPFTALNTVWRHIEREAIVTYFDEFME